MGTTLVLALIVYDLILFLGAIFQCRNSPRRTDTLLLSVLFFCSGMPALVYQIVWQRALFAIYGVNAESVAVVVSAFMLGLGLGSLAGGWLSARFPRHAVMAFGVAELGVSLYGLNSLRIFHSAASYTAGASLPSTVVLSLLLLIIPTMLMGATLPLLVEHLVRYSGRVGYSVATLYFVNTLGSAVACYLCATILLRTFGQSGSVMIAACINLLVSATAFLLGGRRQIQAAEVSVSVSSATCPGEPFVPLAMAMLITGLSGFIGLGLEIAYFRVFALSSADRAPAFALLLSTYLAGIAAGSYISEKLTEREGSAIILQTVGVLMLLGGAISAYMPPLVALLRWKNIPFLVSAPAFFLTAALLGSVLPLLCHLSVSADGNAGKGVSLVYVSNILGSTFGSLLIGFVVLQYLALTQVLLALGVAAVMTGSFVLFWSQLKLAKQRPWALPIILVALVAVPAASLTHSKLLEKLILGSDPAGEVPFAHVVENRNGVITVMQNGAVLGNGVYDGHFSIDPTNDVNMIVRAFALSVFHPAPKRMLEIGLSSGSWAQVLVNHPQLESLDIVEINPGYLQLIRKYKMVQSLLDNPKVHTYIDDGRRWMLAHPETRYDAIVENTSFYWRDHSSDLLSVDFLKIIRRHLSPGGVFYYNTTGSDDVVATDLSVFPYGLRVINFLAVSDSPIDFNKDRWISILRQYKIDNHLVFDPGRSQSETTLTAYVALADSIKQSPIVRGMETSESMNARMGRRLIITDDNMGWEWRDPETVPTSVPTR